MKMRLFTPGPLNMSREVKRTMMEDIGSRMPHMVALTRTLRLELAEVADCGKAYSVVPMQGSGTFAVESMMTSLLGDADKVLVAVNGPYGKRIANICEIHHLSYVVVILDANQPLSLFEIEQALKRDSSITHIAIVHFETGLGILNDTNAVLRVATQYGVRVLIDAMSSFGALPIDFDHGALLAVAASANKCLHGAPGLGFIIAKKAVLDAHGRPRTLSLDLRAQYREFEASGEWRFTPPTHIVLALTKALKVYKQQGGRPARLEKYRKIAHTIVSGMQTLGITTLIDQKYSAPIIMTFVLPVGEEILSASHLSERLMQQKIVVYPSMAKHTNSFRVGFIGEITEQDAVQLIDAIRAILFMAMSSSEL